MEGVYIYPVIVAVTLLWATLTALWAIYVSPPALRKVVGLTLATMAVGMGGLLLYYIALTIGILNEGIPGISRVLLIVDKLAVILFIPLIYGYFLGITPATTLRQIRDKLFSWTQRTR